MKYHPDYHAAVKMQRLLMKDIENPMTTPKDRAQLVRAWDALADRKRILRNKGLPKAVDPLKKPYASPRASAPVFEEA